MPSSQPAAASLVVTLSSTTMCTPSGPACAPSHVPAIIILHLCITHQRMRCQTAPQRKRERKSHSPFLWETRRIPVLKKSLKHRIYERTGGLRQATHKRYSAEGRKGRAALDTRLHVPREITSRSKIRQDGDVSLQLHRKISVRTTTFVAPCISKRTESHEPDRSIEVLPPLHSADASVRSLLVV